MSHLRNLRSTPRVLHSCEPQARAAEAGSLSTQAMGLTGFFRVFFRYLRPYRFQAVMIVLALLVDLLFDTALRLSFKYLIDDVLVTKNSRLLVIILAALAVGVVLASLAGVCRDYFYARLTGSLLNDIRYKLFCHLQRLSMGFYSKAQVGDLMARFSTDLSSVENAVVAALPGGLIAIFGTLFAVIPLFLLEWHMALGVMICLPFCLLGPKMLERRASDANYAFKEEQGAVASTVQENISAQAVVKAFSLEQSAQTKFRQQLDRLFRIGVRANFLNYLMERTPTLSVLVLELLVVGAGSFLVFNDHLTVGSFVSFYVLFVSVNESVYCLTWVVPSLMEAAAGMQRVEEILTERADIPDAPGATPLEKNSREIAFQNVSFGYAPEHTVLKEASLAIAHGSRVAFVGPSGSGKSTALNLIMRFYDPGQGLIAFDGRDVRTVTQESLRSRMGVVFQENFLFNTSIRENIRMGKPGAADPEVEAAAKAAEIHDFIVSQPQGYDTVVGERGGHLSGGQRQRIAIARAILRQPEILLLDEATSALDAGTESAINATLERAAKGCTVISVTHRLSAVAGFDCIFVLDSGKIVERGRHGELLSQHGVYKQLWEKQSGFVLSQEGEQAAVHASWLRNVPMFVRLPLPLLKEVAGLFITELAQPGRALLQQGDSGDRLFIIVRGKVEVVRTHSTGKEERLAVLEDGDYFGEIALLRNMPHVASIRALTPCVFLTLARQRFATLVARAPELRGGMEQTIDKRLADDRITRIMHVMNPKPAK